MFKVHTLVSITYVYAVHTYIRRPRVTVVGCVCVSARLISHTVTNRPRRLTYLGAPNDSAKTCFYP